LIKGFKKKLIKTHKNPMLFKQSFSALIMIYMFIGPLNQENYSSTHFIVGIITLEICTSCQLGNP
jgi:hypothetical protein